MDGAFLQCSDPMGRASHADGARWGFEASGVLAEDWNFGSKVPRGGNRCLDHRLSSAQPVGEAGTREGSLRQAGGSGETLIVPI